MTDFCAHGCYWECDHPEAARAIEAGELAERARLRAVTENDRLRQLQDCIECGGRFRDAAWHAREHARMRQLGWMSRSDSMR